MFNLFVSKKTYDAKVAELEIVSDVLAETQAAERRLTAGRDDWKSAAKDWEAKFKKAVTDLAAARDDIGIYENALNFSLDGQCPICGGIEGCSHTRSERVGNAIARVTGDSIAVLKRMAEQDAETIARLTPLAKKYEDKLERDRNRVRPSRAKSPAKAGKKGVVK